MGRVLPPAWMTGMAIGILALCRWGNSWATSKLLDADPLHKGIWIPVVEASFKVLVGVTCFTGAIYGIWRALGRNPLCWRDYRDWLCRTPWRSPQPLPWGHVLPVIQDVIPLAVLTLFVWGVAPENMWTLPAIAALSAYAVSLFLLLLWRQPRDEMYVVVWLVTLGVYFRETPAVWTTLLLLNVALLGLAVHKTLEAIRLLPRPFLTRQSDVADFVDENRPLGAPFTVLAPMPVGNTVPWRHAIAIGVTAALIVWSMRLGPPMQEGARMEWIFSLQIAFFLALFRLMAYRPAVHSPLTLLGRLKTRRLVIPRFDCVYVAPLVIVTSGTLIGFAIRQMPVYLTTQLAIVLGILTTLALGLPPSLEEWRLTGEHRLNLRWNSTKNSRTGNAVRRT